MSTLIIAEKPSAARSIAARLGNPSKREGHLQVGDYKVAWAFGHLYEQAPPDHYKQEWKSWSKSQLPMIPDKWELLPKPDAKAQIKIIQNLLKTTELVIHAGDPDDEGELLIWEILEAAKWTGPTKRLWLSAMDDASIDKALKTLKNAKETYGFKLAAECRSRADWLVGMNLSRAATLRAAESGNTGVLSVGRVQTPTLAIVVARDLLIENFKPTDYFEVKGNFAFRTNPVIAMWQPPKELPGLDEEGRVVVRAQAEKVAAECDKANATVTKYETKNGSQAAPNPFSLADIQATASAKFGFSAQKTLDICQALYETHKVASYPRTDCVYLPVSMHADAPKVMQGLSNAYAASQATNAASIKTLISKANLSLKHSAFNDSKITAHHGIIPTGAGTLNNLSADEEKVFDLIARRYIALFYPNFLYLQTTILIECEGHEFKATGRTVKDLGWKVVLGTEDDKTEQTLPLLNIGDKGKCEKAEVLAKQTKPPARYTEGTLLKAMENISALVTDPKIKEILKESGIGTPATRAQIMETLKKRGFLEVQQKKFLVSTITGRAFIHAMPAEMTKPDLTAAYEARLAEIRKNTGSPEEFLQKQAIAIKKFVDRILNSATKFEVPNYAKPATVSKTKTGKAGSATTKKPATKATKPVGQPAKPGEQACPKCGKAMVKRTGARGDFFGCSGFPTCKTIVNIPTK